MRQYWADPARRARANELARESYWRNHTASLERSRHNHLKNTYGLTEGEYCAMHAAQDGRCAICGEQKTLVIDHDHQTGEVRGLLCNRCNTGLRIVEEPERLAAAQDYLRGCHLGGSSGEEAAKHPDAEGCALTR